ncbi:MAG TPA: CPBP family intramembrane metalloprotease [Peptococcaceae bacterium]|nr:CPBP family intramembrane metalloprotease [Peptococcaceae bacterium]
MLFINRFIFQIATELKTAYYLSIVALNILFVILILSVKTSNKITWLELGWKKTEVKRGVINVLKIWGLIWLIDFIYMLIIVSMGIIPEGNELVYLLEKPTVPTLIINIILIAVVAPFIEETLFRGLLFGSLRTYFGCWTAITISAAFFSALHFQLIGFVPRFLLGLGLGYLYVKHDSIYPAVGLHALNNFLAVLMVSLLS